MLLPQEGSSRTTLLRRGLCAEPADGGGLPLPASPPCVQTSRQAPPVKAGVTARVTTKPASAASEGSLGAESSPARSRPRPWAGRPATDDPQSVALPLSVLCVQGHDLQMGIRPPHHGGEETVDTAQVTSVECGSEGAGAKPPGAGRSTLKAPGI